MPSTVREIREAIASQIILIVPTEVARRQYTWTRVSSQTDVPGAEIRNFHIGVSSPVAVTEDAIYSPDAIEHGAVVSVTVSYGSLPPDEVDALSAPDGQQIWLRIDTRRDGAGVEGIDDLWSFQYSGYEALNDEDGHEFGTHTYELRFLATGVL